MGGCLSIPEEATQGEKSRLLRDAHDNPTAPGQSAINSADDVAYGAHDAEKTKLSEILNRTARDVIDVRSTFEPMAGQDLLDRQSQYSNVIKSVHVPGAGPSGMSEIVQNTRANVVQILERGASPSNQKDADLAKAVCSDLSEALKIEPAQMEVVGLL